MLGQKPQAVIRQVLRAGGAPSEEARRNSACVVAAGAMRHCFRCGLHFVKASARYTLNHEVLIDVLKTKDASGERHSLFRSCSTKHLSTPSPWSVQKDGIRRHAAAFSASRLAWEDANDMGVFKKNLSLVVTVVQHPSRERSRFLGNSFEETATCFNSNWMSWSFRRTVGSSGCAPSGGWSL